MNLRTAFLVSIYLSAIVIANVLAATFGPAITPINAFFLIGMDLTVRDALHDRWTGRGLAWRMAALIGAGSVLSYAVNAGAGRIALASCIAFGAAGTVDALIYHALHGRPRLQRIMGSNVVSAGVDSLIFPTLAFGVLLPGVILLQWAAKVAGSYLWARVLLWRHRAAVPA